MSKNVKKSPFLRSGGPRDPLFHGPIGPYQTPPFRGVKYLKMTPFFIQIPYKTGVIIPPKRGYTLWNCCHFTPKSLKSGFLRRKNGYFFFLLHSSFFLSLDEISSKLTLIYIYIGVWGTPDPLIRAYGGVKWGVFRGILGLFLALNTYKMVFGLGIVDCGGLMRCRPFRCYQTQTKPTT